MKDAGGMQMKSQKKKISKNVRNKILCFFGALLLSGVTIAAVLKGGGISPDELKGFLLEAKIGGIFFAVVCMLGFIFFEGAALTVIVRALGYPVKHGRGFLYSAADIYFSAITPSASGGQPASAFFMIRDGIPVTAVMASLVLNLIMYTLAVVTTGVLAVIFFPETYFIFDLPGRLLIAVGVLIMLGLSLVFYFLLKKPDILKKLCGGLIVLFEKIHWQKAARKLREKLDSALEEYGQCVKMIFGKKKMLAKAYGLNLLQRFSQLLVTLGAFSAIGGSKSLFPKLFAIQVYVVLGSNSIPVPGAMGVADYLMINGYLELMNKEQAYQLEIISRGLSFYACMILSLITVGVGYILLKPKEKRKEKNK